MPILFADRLYIVLDVGVYFKWILVIPQADLGIAQSLALYNDGVQYLVNCFDKFSKYVWVR